MASNIGYAIKRLRRIVADGRARMDKNLISALSGFPPKSQVKELKEIADEMHKAHKAMMQLAAARNSANFRSGKKYRINSDTISLNVEEVERRFGLPGAAHATREMHLGPPDELAEPRRLRKSRQGRS